MSMLAQPARLDAYWTAFIEEQTKAKRPMIKDLQTLRTQYRVSDFIDWQASGSLVLNPYFQRRSVWPKGAKSYLIDTIVRGLPIPIIFIRDLKADLKNFKQRRDVVDGQQRLRTIISFVNPSLLKDFNAARDEFTISSAHNEELGGKSFRDLPAQYRQRILDYQFSVHSFPGETDDREILQIFARMNSTGYKLNAQELRNAEFFGAFKALALDLSTEQLNRWRDWRIFTADQIARMNEFELTSEFMMLIMRGILEKNNKTIADFYGAYDTKSFAEGREVAARFRKVFDTIDSSFSTEQLAKLFSNRTVFYALFASIYGMQYGLRKPPGPKESFTQMEPIKRGFVKLIKPAAIAHILASGKAIKDKAVKPKVAKALRGATTDAAQRRVLIGFLTGKYDPCPTKS